MSQEIVPLSLELTDSEIRQYKAFLKRVRLSDYETNAKSQEEARGMQEAGEKIRIALVSIRLRPAPKTRRLNLELTDAQAWRYAEFLKRVSLSDYRARAKSQDDAYSMLGVGEKIRAALAQAGYAPR